MYWSWSHKKTKLPFCRLVVEDVVNALQKTCCRDDVISQRRRSSSSARRGSDLLLTPGSSLLPAPGRGLPAPPSRCPSAPRPTLLSAPLLLLVYVGAVYVRNVGCVIALLGGSAAMFIFVFPGQFRMPRFTWFAPFASCVERTGCVTLFCRGTNQKAVCA